MSLRASFVVFSLIGSLGMPTPVSAASPNSRSAPDAVSPLTEALTSQVDGLGVAISWRGFPTVDAAGKATVNDGSVWALTQANGTWLPVRYVALEAPAQAKVEPELLDIESTEWSGVLDEIEPIIPIDPMSGMAYPELARKQVVDLPSSPVYVSHESVMRGRRIVMLAVSPIFAVGGKPRMATRIRAKVAGVTVFDSANATFSADRGISLPSAASKIDAPDAPLAYAINPLANQSAIRITATRAGLQKVSASALSSLLLLNLSTTNKDRVRLYFLGNEIPLHYRDLGTPGQFDGSDEFVFYAPTVGDRYNQSSIFWMSVDPAVDGARMGLRSAQVVTPALTAATSVIERRFWRNPVSYQSTLAGLDGDHWFNKLLTTGMTFADPLLTISMPISMPAASGSSLISLSVYARVPVPHTLRATVGASQVDSSWTGFGDNTRVFAMSDSASTANFNFLNIGYADSLWVDSATYERPVLPDVSGSGGGGDFYTLPGVERIYTLAGYNASWQAYDVTDPAGPKLLQTSGQQTQDGPTQRHYIVGGPGFVSTPILAANTAVDLVTARSADAVYVGPSALHTTLGPLMTLRQGQGYQTQVIDVAAIYSTFGFGMVSPGAIRNFFRHAVGTWTRKPIAGILVGDGTMDPFNYMGNPFFSANYIPPFLLNVDPYSGETACDTCYGQLDGDDPLSDAMPDIWIGRLTGDSATEVGNVVAKIVTYESNATISNWNKTLGWLADNYQEAGGGTDAGGNFADYQERLANHPWDAVPGLAPSGTIKACAYYNPYLPTVGSNPCFESNNVNVRAKTMNLINLGAAIITYDGHGNQTEMAKTVWDAPYPNTALLSYWDPFNEGQSVDPYGNPTLNNGTKQPIMLQLTCLTGSFHTPDFDRPHAIDERLVLAPNAGALAVWGSTGKGVSHGHDFLARGFFNRLWVADPGTARLGELIQSGYLSLFQGAYACCGDSIRTYLLLGDPLTKPRVSFTPLYNKRVYIPNTLR